ncbi:MAG: transporter [Sterolibacterium sp.]|jgi:hypothetical protein
MRISTLLSGLLLVASPTAWAFQPLVTDDTGTQGQDGNQLEFSVDHDREESAGVTNSTRTLPFTYTRGLSDTLDAFVSVNHSRLSSSVPGSDASGSGNPSLGLKWRFYENEASKMSFALKPELLLPVGADKEAAGLGTGRSSYGLTLILTRETGFGAVHANLAAGRNRYRDTLASPDPDTSTVALSIAPVWDLNDRWKLALDVGTEWEREAAGNKSRSNFVELGAIYSPSKDLDLAFGILRRSDDATPGSTVYAATAGITWRFK